MPPRRRTKVGVDAVDSDVPAATTRRSQAKKAVEPTQLRRSSRRRASTETVEMEETKDDEYDEDESSASDEKPKRSTRSRTTKKSQPTKQTKRAAPKRGRGKQKKAQDDDDEDSSEEADTTSSSSRNQRRATEEEDEPSTHGVKRKLTEAAHEEMGDQDDARHHQKQHKTSTSESVQNDEVVTLEQRVELCVAHGEILIETTAKDADGNEREMGAITVAASVPGSPQTKPTEYTINLKSDNTVCKHSDDHKEHDMVLDDREVHSIPENRNLSPAPEFSPTGTRPTSINKEIQMHQANEESLKPITRPKTPPATPTPTPSRSRSRSSSPARRPGTPTTTAASTSTSFARVGSDRDEAAAKHKTRRYRVAYRTNEKQCSVCDESIRIGELAVEYCNTHSINYNPSTPTWDAAFHCDNRCMKPLHTMLIYDIYGEPAFVEGFTNLILTDQQEFVALARRQHKDSDHTGATTLEPPMLENTDEAAIKEKEVPVTIKPLEYIEADYVADSCRHTDPRVDIEIIQKYQKEMRQREEFHRKVSDAASTIKTGYMTPPGSPTLSHLHHRPSTPTTRHIDGSVGGTGTHHESFQKKDAMMSDGENQSIAHIKEMSQGGSHPELKFCVATTPLKCIHCDGAIQEGYPAIGILNSESTAQNPVYRYRHMDRSHQTCVDFSFGAFIMSLCGRDIERIDGFHTLPPGYQQECREVFLKTVSE